MTQVCLTLTPQQAADGQSIQKAVARELRLPFEAIYAYRIQKRSVDARQRQIKVLLTVQAFLSADEAQLPPYEQPLYRDVHEAQRQVLIVGAGPAGLFAALTLLQKGIRPVIIERGKPVSERKVDIACLNKNEGIRPESNYCFGEGGAGTFSDGKLFSRSKKRGNMQRVMELFHYHGAADSVLYEAHAHIGSDRLPAIIRSMREAILEHGGIIRFEEKFTGISREADGAIRILTDRGTYTGEAVILAIGHSAHDTYRLLAQSGISLQPKGFALGVRAEHPQWLIDDLMYHSSPLRKQGLLPAASYSLVTQVHNEFGQRGAYSFCMCPGGHIVPAGSTAHSGVVNGMSASHRNSPFANSGMVVELHPEDMVSYDTLQTGDLLSTEAALECLEWQEKVEETSWQHGAVAAGQPESAIAPGQRLKDFVEGRESKDLPKTSYLPGCIPSRLDQWLPPVVSKALRQGFRDFDRKYPGFLTNEAVILGVESRSSSPVRIPRDPETLQHPAFPGLYPAGEGAGYAGGITSSALDGINAALRIAGE
ncbi:MAG: NAD(P)/FAD-dependent oxidoreductase [Bacteroidales bacterium]|nr:NAD(P)/FAD-dependent oxidoreductase [Candidatus Colicola faecequi]